MISLLTQLIQTHPQWLRTPGSELSFMKVSTPASGLEKGKGKVLLFVFEQGEREPTLCVKATREHAAHATIEQNYKHLVLLQEGVQGSALETMFAKPLYISNDNPIFSVESACSGEVFSARNPNIELVAETYGAWQAHLASTAQTMLHTEDLEKLVHRLLSALGLSKLSQQELKNYFKTLPLSAHIELPSLIQHGDMTPDNVLVSGDSVCLIDYDYVGISQLPGFDLFNFLSKLRTRREPFRYLCDRYFPLYFERIGANIEAYDGVFFAYYLQELSRKEYRVNDADIKDKFVAFMNRT